MPEPKFLTVDHLTTSDITRIFSKIQVNPLTDCWEWQGKLSHGGKYYGCLWFRGKEERAHRVLYAWLIEPVPIGVAADIPNLDHEICNNKKCCNPVHIRLKPQKENTLRSESNPTALNARKKCCPKGHCYKTVIWSKGNTRVCATCRRESQIEIRKKYTQKEHQKYLEYHRQWKHRKKEKTRAVA